MSHFQPMRACVFLVAPFGASARYLLRTEILQTLLSSGARVVALLPNSDEAYIREELVAQGVEVAQLRAASRPTGVLWTTLVYLRQNALGEGCSAETVQSRYANARRELARHHPLAARLLHPVLRVLWRSRTARRTLVWVESKLVSPRSHRDLYDRYRPSLVVTTSPGWFLEDALVLREAAAEGVASAALVLAWDNPTSKGYRGARPDWVVGWSDAMAWDLIRCHDLPRRRVLVGGVPQFDVYDRIFELPSRTELFEQLGLDPDRRLILFAGRSPSTYSHNVTVAERLAAAVADGELAMQSQLVVRPHPIHLRSDHDRRPLAEYEEVLGRFRNAILDIPVVSSDRLSCDVPEDDFRRLAALVAHCDVLVNAFSTTTLEAFLVDKPVVLVSDEAHASEGLGDRSPEGRPFHRDTHMQPLLARGAARVARSFDELVPAIDRYLEEPHLDAAARRHVIETEVGGERGHAGRNVGSLLFELSRGPTSVPAAGTGTVSPAPEAPRRAGLPSRPGRPVR